MVTKKQARAGIKSNYSAQVKKNPKDWRRAFRLLVVDPKGQEGFGRLVFSQHDSKGGAEVAKVKLLKKHKTLNGVLREMGFTV